MHLTNKTNLPEPIVIASKAFDIDYTSGRRETDFSVTELLKDPLQIQLKRRHYDEISEDVLDRIWAIDGSAWHYVVEQCGKLREYKTEARFFTRIHGKLISGQADLYHLPTMTLYDYKNTSVFKIKKGADNIDWVGQLNILAYLAEINGTPVRSLEIVAKSKDWRRAEYTKAKLANRDYPEVVTSIKIPKYPLIKVRKRLEELVKSHLGAEDKDIAKIPVCADTWGGRKCKDYCSVKQWCPYYKEDKGV